MFGTNFVWGGGQRSLAWIFSAVLARKSSGIARIFFFLHKNGHLKNSGGGGAAAL